MQLGFAGYGGLKLMPGVLCNSLFLAIKLPKEGRSQQLVYCLSSSILWGYKMKLKMGAL